jgi:hypothetical protein
MSWKIRIIAISLGILLLQACGIYSFTGANIEGKTINVQFIDNNADLVNPVLSAQLTESIRNKVLGQTKLVQVNADVVDYVIKGNITTYKVSVAGVQNFQTAATNRLTISVSINFENKIDNKKSFTKSFSKFGDFPASQTLAQAEQVLLEQLCKELADAIFNDAFVNW